MIIIADFDRENLSVVLVLKEFKQLLHLTDHDRGLLNSAFFLSYAVLQIPAGWFVDRCGVKYPVAAGFLLWSLVSAATAMTRSARQLFFVRLVLGVSESVVTPASLRWIRFHYAEDERGVAVGLYGSGQGWLGHRCSYRCMASGDFRLAWHVSDLGSRVLNLASSLVRCGKRRSLQSAKAPGFRNRQRGRLLSAN